MISDKNTIAGQAVSFVKTDIRTATAQPVLHKQADTLLQKAATSVTGEHGSSGDAFFRKEKKSTFPIPLSSPREAKKTLPQTGKGGLTETPPLIHSTPVQQQQTPALVWRNKNNTPQENISSGDHPLMKSIPISRNSPGTDMLSRYAQTVSSADSVPETTAVDNIANNDSSAQRASGSGIDLSVIADQVSRIIFRKLAVECERRGL